MVQQCDYLLPDQYGATPEGLHDNPHPPCLLKRRHDGAHLVRGEGMFGGTRYYEWQKADQCPQPDACAEYVSCQHFLIWEIGIIEAEDRLKKEGPSA